MSGSRDAIIVGSGLNGLACAAALAQAGRKVLVLERRHVLGGRAAVEEFHPGFRCTPALDVHAYAEQPVLVPVPDGRWMMVHGASDRAADIATFLPKDGARYREVMPVLRRIAAAIAPVLALTPPDIDHPAVGELWGLLKVGRGIKKLGEKDMYRLLRWGPMAVADLAAEWFEFEPLRAAVAAPGIHATALGPWSAGSALTLLLHYAGGKAPAGTADALVESLKQAGGEIRTGVEVASVLVKDGRAAGVALVSGEEISARVVVSGADPKRTLLGMVDPAYLAPDFLRKMHNFRCNGTVAKLHLALDALPDIPTRDSQGRPARIHIGPEIDYLERAFDASKYGEFSAQPYLDVSFPSLHQPAWAPQGKHVMSVHVQYAPYRLRNGDWKSRRDELADVVMKTLAAHMPDLAGKVLHRHVVTPLDLEETYGLTGGHLRHGELSLDQLFTMRPVLGWARYATPVGGLYLCGAGTHPASFDGQCGRNAAREIARSMRK